MNINPNFNPNLGMGTRSNMQSMNTNSGGRQWQGTQNIQLNTPVIIFNTSPRLQLWYKFPDQQQHLKLIPHNKQK
jgi:hypothetical protein